MKRSHQEALHSAKHARSVAPNIGRLWISALELTPGALGHGGCVVFLEEGAAPKSAVLSAPMLHANR